MPCPRSRAVLLAIIVAAAGILPTAAHAEPDPAETDVWLSGTNIWGARGTYRLDAAQPLHPGALVLTAGLEVSNARNLFAPDDLNSYQRWQFHAVVAPMPGLEVGFGGSLTSNAYTDFVLHTIQTVGRPTLDIKYSDKLSPSLGIGAAVHLLVPTAAEGGGLVPRAGTAAGVLLASYQLGSLVELTGNVGYTLDRSGQLTGPGISAERRFALEVTNYNRVTYGVGAQTALDIADTLVVGPFAELTGAALQGLATKHAPVRATFGTKVYGSGAHLVEGIVGADLRLSGAPDGVSAYAGIPPWQAFAGLSVHIFAYPEPVAIQRGCHADSACGTGQVCRDEICVLIEVQVREVEKEVVREATSFTVTGNVSDSADGSPISSASVLISGYDKTPLTVNYKTGAFHSFPIPTGKGLLKIVVSAPGYQPIEKVVPRGQADEDVNVEITLITDSKPATGIVRGNLKDGRTGAIINDGSVFVPTLQRKVAVDDKGNYELTVKVGEYDILINAKHYDTQRKHIVIHEGDVIILNIDLQRTR